MEKERRSESVPKQFPKAFRMERSLKSNYLLKNSMIQALYKQIHYSVIEVNYLINSVFCPSHSSIYSQWNGGYLTRVVFNILLKNSGVTPIYDATCFWGKLRMSEGYNSQKLL